MVQRLKQWRAILSIYFQDGLAYRASVFIWILTDGATAAVMPLVLAAAAQGGLIQGFNAQDFVVYYIISLLVTNFVSCHFMWEFAMEIKDGIFSTFLLRPMPYLEFMAMRNLAWRLVRSVLFVPLLGVLLLAYQGQIGNPTLYWGPEAILAVFLGHLVSFLSVMALATLAFYVQEATSFFELYYIPMLFLSGQMFPIAMFPDWARNLALFTPFYYTTGFPTELIIGRLTPEQSWPLLGVQVFWCVLSYVLFRIFFKRGLKEYTGTGM